MSSAMQPLSSSHAEGAIKDTTGAQVILKTLDKMNTSATLTGPAVDAGYQFRKDMLNTAGRGTRLDTTV